MMIDRDRNNLGFTLIELMVSIAVLMLMMTMIFSGQAQMQRSSKRIEARQGAYQQGRVALRKISDDLSMAFLTKAAKVEGSSSAANDAFKTFLIGEDKGESDEVRFSSLSHLRYFSGAKESDQCKIAYEVVQDKENPAKQNIVRREQAWLDEKTEVEGKDYVLAEGVKKLNIEYYDERQEEWGPAWDTEKIDWKDKLPIAVRITIEIVDPNKENGVITLTTAFMMPYSTGAIEL